MLFLLKKRADPTKEIVKKKIKCFIWENQYFELVELVEPNNGMLFFKNRSRKYFTKD